MPLAVTATTLRLDGFPRYSHSITMHHAEPERNLTAVNIDRQY
jgi:hypothetical protein